MASTSNEWQQIYHNNLTGPPHPTVLRWSGGDLTTEATTVTSTTTTLTTATSFSNHLSRVARPSNTRRRSRVSRRTPTTLLNTDTTNFRAMVQQFTGGNSGGGSAAFIASTATVNAPRLQPLSSSYNSSTISSGSSNYYGGTGSRISPPSAGDYNVEFRQPQHHQYYSSVSGGAGDQEYHQHGFVQEGGANISGAPIHGHNNTAFKF